MSCFSSKVHGNRNTWVSCIISQIGNWFDLNCIGFPTKANSAAPSGRGCQREWFSTRPHLGKATNRLLTLKPPSKLHKCAGKLCEQQSNHRHQCSGYCSHFCRLQWTHCCRCLFPRKEKLHRAVPTTIAETHFHSSRSTFCALFAAKSAEKSGREGANRVHKGSAFFPLPFHPSPPKLRSVVSKALFVATSMSLSMLTRLHDSSRYRHCCKYDFSRMIYCQLLKSDPEEKP